MLTSLEVQAKCHVLVWETSFLCDAMAPVPSLLCCLHSLTSNCVTRLSPSLRTAQFTLGFGAYLYPTVAKRHREALGPLHTYLGKATFVAGLANMAVCDSLRSQHQPAPTSSPWLSYHGFVMHCDFASILSPGTASVH